MDHLFYINEIDKNNIIDEFFSLKKGKMDTALLKNFLVVARTKNFTKAAEKLFRSQSAISLQIAKLESLIGKPLLHRTKKSVGLTTDGEQLMAYAEQFLQIEQAMLDHFQQPTLTGKVSFGTPEDIATVYLPPILGDFLKTHTGIELNFNCEYTLDLIRGFDAGRYDLVLIKQDPLKPHPRSEEIWKEALVWVSSKESSLRHEIIPLILSPAPCVYRERAITALNQRGLPWRIVYSTTSLSGTIAAVKAGLGMTVLPLKVVPEEFRILNHLPLLQDAQVALLQQEKASSATRALAKYVRSHLLTGIRT